MPIQTGITPPIVLSPTITNRFAILFELDGSFRILDSNWNPVPLYTARANPNVLNLADNESVVATLDLQNSSIFGEIIAVPLGWHTHCRGGGKTTFGNVNSPLLDGEGGSRNQLSRWNSAKVTFDMQTRQTSPGNGVGSIKVEVDPGSEDRAMIQEYQLPVYDPAVNARLGLIFIRYAGGQIDPQNPPSITFDFSNIDPAKIPDAVNSAELI
ncbi:MAG: hypothetical protein ACPGN3_12460 [Opitutales bacterium]